ncbi:MAG TPA: AcvB/VirJ family lysyl-phosphatidylglycerol hydrolase, partial [Rariglobus sp.]
YVPPTGAAVRGLCVFGSGDGGWSYWEEIVCAHLAKRGWAVAGVDFSKYSVTDYTQAILVADYGRLTAELERRTGAPMAGEGARPVVYGGWSMGAEQALPAAADVPARPAGLRGLLLVAPGARGRYGLHTKDKLGFTPTGEGTFGLGDFAPQLHDLRLAQLHAGLDPLDSIKWYHGLKLDLRLWKYPRAFHDFDGASDDFLKLVDEALAWILSPPPRVEEKP